MAGRRPGVKMSENARTRRDKRKKLAKRMGLSTWAQAVAALEEDILPNLKCKVSPVDIGKVLRNHTEREKELAAGQ